ncbi:MAG: flagellar basal body rod protein FlgB [Bacillota bacterium]
MLFNNSSFIVLEKQLDASALRQQVIANNIANANTPGFKKSEVSFNDQLRAALDTKRIHLQANSPRHITARHPLHNIAPLVKTTEDTIMTYGQNNVDTEQEMVNLAANTILYNAASRMLGGKFTTMGHIIRGGK